MTRFTDPLPHSPKPKPPLRSWWADPALQTDRAAFDQHLETQEMDRIKGSQRFGGSKMTHDKFTQDHKK